MWRCILLIAFTSCSLFQYQNREHVLSTPTITASMQGPLRFGQWPKKEWWSLFSSDTLSSLMEKGLKSNPSLQQAKERIEQAKQIALQKRSFLFPWLSVDFNEQWSRLSKTGLIHSLNPSLPLHANLLDLGLTMDYTFDFWSKYRNTFKAALGLSYAEEAEAKQVELLITTAIAQSYFSLTTNYARKSLYERLLTLRTRLASLQNLLQESGLDSNLPLYLANEQVEDARKALLAVDDEIAISHHLINALIGEGPDYLVEYTPLTDAPQKIEIPPEISLDLVSHRPDLVAATWRMESLAHLVGARIADFFPNVSLRGFLGFESLQSSQWLTSSGATGALYPAIHLPIFTAGNIRAGVNEKKAEFEQAVFHYNDLLLKAAKEVANNLVIVDTFYAQKQSQQIIVDNALLRFDLRYARMQSGLDNLLDLYEEEILLITKQLQDLDLVYGQYFSIIELIKSLGGGYAT